MKNFKHVTVVFSMLLVAMFFMAGRAVAQGDAVNSVKQAMKAGSAKDLSKHFGRMVVIKLDDGEATTYSGTQAEFVMKNFFAKNPPVSFDPHNGTSSDGLAYILGEYVSNDETLMVVIRMKPVGDKYFIHKIEFDKD
ncbi:DUF4783 domain-containing protein [Pontibacter oryzae]|uniref:DUF4783 domain-containing protein n=1 Tax=Pontibacter oryzae TaxID=2304593 RepID=A0A399S499_9BACT|nr:DUF4783 domain-containing protein [Pontibacter oryzae]RIJ37574.1 DUF4783 domain-containing protein [Pontibacter oryzae]